MLLTGNSFENNENLLASKTFCFIRQNEIRYVFSNLTIMYLECISELFKRYGLSISVEMKLVNNYLRCTNNSSSLNALPLLHIENQLFREIE